MKTFTQRIFELSAPYDNPYQGEYPRWLFVCSAGLLRSPTGAAVASSMGVNSRSCGSAKYALIPISTNLVMWAQKIFFVNMKNFEQAMETFEGTGYSQQLAKKSVILDIEDEFEYMHPKLVKLFEKELAEYIK